MEEKTTSTTDGNEEETKGFNNGGKKNLFQQARIHQRDFRVFYCFLCSF